MYSETGFWFCQRAHPLQPKSRPASSQRQKLEMVKDPVLDYKTSTSSFSGRALSIGGPHLHLLPLQPPGSAWGPAQRKVHAPPNEKQGCRASRIGQEGHSRTVGAGPEMALRLWPKIGHQQRLSDHVVLGRYDIIRKAQGKSVVLTGCGHHCVAVLCQSCICGCVTQWPELRRSLVAVE